MASGCAPQGNVFIAPAVLVSRRSEVERTRAQARRATVDEQLPLKRLDLEALESKCLFFGHVGSSRTPEL